MKSEINVSYSRILCVTSNHIKHQRVTLTFNWHHVPHVIDPPPNAIQVGGGEGVEGHLTTFGRDGGQPSIHEGLPVEGRHPRHGPFSFG